ncbi:hypothetical protein PROP_02698 [Propionicimonas sp. T2.31MG-18]
MVTADGASVRFSGRRSDNRVESRLHDLLNAAQVEYRTKEAVWRVLQSASGLRRVAAIEGLELPDALRSAVCELLLADA